MIFEPSWIARAQCGLIYTVDKPTTVYVAHVRVPYVRNERVIGVFCALEEARASCERHLSDWVADDAL